MRKAIATFGIGPHRELLALVMPTFIEYSARNDYDVIVGTGDSCGRPPSWGKVLLLQRLLGDYDFVLWLDADVVILDSSMDLERTVPESAFQALPLVGHGWNQGPYPNFGVWALRRSEMSHRFLSEVWAQDDLIDHANWEQAAALRTLGWLEWPFRKVTPTRWDRGTYYLPEQWNMMPVHPIGYARGFFRHYGGMSNAQRLMEVRTDIAGLEVSQCAGVAKVRPLLRYQLGRVARVPTIQRALKIVRRSTIDLLDMMEKVRSRLSRSMPAASRAASPFTGKRRRG